MSCLAVLSTPDSLGCQATDLIPPQVSRKESLRVADHYTDSEQASRLVRSAKLRSAKLPVFTLTLV